MIQSPLRVSETFSGVLKGQSYFHYNTKIYLPFTVRKEQENQIQ